MITKNMILPDPTLPIGLLRITPKLYSFCLFHPANTGLSGLPHPLIIRPGGHPHRYDDGPDLASSLTPPKDIRTYFRFRAWATDWPRKFYPHGDPQT